MSRLGRRRRRSPLVVAATLLVLATPAAAHAATYSVGAGAGACGGADLACEGLAEAAAVAAPGDVFNLAAGVYSAANFTVGGIAINGAPGTGILGTMQFSGAAGGVSQLSRVVVAQTTGAGSAVLVTGASGLQASDVIALSSNGHGVQFNAGTANKVVRSAIVTGGQSTSALRIENIASSAAQALTVESTLLIGGASGIGAVTTSAPVLPGPAGAITLALRHITAAGSTNGIVLNASAGSNLLNNGAGSITATLSDSIALNNIVLPTTGLNPNTAVINADAQSIRTGAPGDLFADAARGNYRLRVGSPAIGRGGVTPGESPTDFDGEDRSVAPTDLGADEFSNAPPVAKLAVATKSPRAGQPVTFDGRGSTDRETGAGGGIASYLWFFSDGSGVTTSTPTVEHTFAKQGAAAATLIVVDTQGLLSAPASATLTLTDGDPPTVAIAKPKRNQTLRQFTTKTTTVKRKGKKVKVRKRTRRRIQVGGLSGDTSGIANVVVTIEKIKGSSKTKCYWYDSQKGFRLRSCKKPVILNAKLKKDSKTGEWTFNVPTKRPLSAGKYRVSAYGVDKAGVFGNSAPAKARIVRFTLKK